MKWGANSRVRLAWSAVGALLLAALSSATLFGHAPVAKALTYVATISAGIGENPKFAAASPDGSSVYIGSEGSVQEIDTQSNTVINDYSTWGGVTAMAMSPDGESFAVVSGEQNSIDTYVSVTTPGDIGSFPLQYSYSGDELLSTYGITFTPDSSAFWMFGQGALVVQSLVGSQNSQLIDSWTQIEGVAFSPDGSTAYLMQRYGTIQVVDVQTMTQTGSIELTSDVFTSFHDIAISPSGTILAATDWVNDNVWIVTMFGGQTLTYQVPNVHDAQDLIFDTNAPYVYATGTDGVSTISLNSMSVDSVADAGDSPFGITLVAQTGQLYVTDEISNGTVKVLQAPHLSPTIQSISGTVGQCIASQAFTPAGFDSAVGWYAVDPELPAGLTIDNTTGVVSGCPAVAVNGQTFLVTGTSSTQTSTASVQITVNPTATTTQPTISATAGVRFQSVAPTTAGFPDGAWEWGVTRQLPDGLAINPTTGVISGTAYAAQAAAPYTVTAAGSGFSASFTQSIAVQPGILPAAQSIVATINQSVSTAQLSPYGFDGPVAFAIDPAVPDGMLFDATSGVLSGTPTGVQHSTVYAVTATGGQWSQTATLTLAVQPSLVYPSATMRAVAERPFLIGAPVTDGFPGEPVFTAQGLPMGLSIDAATGAISGTSLTAQLPAEVQVEASDGNYTVTTTLTFSVDPVVTPERTSIGVGAGETVTASFDAIGFPGTARFSVQPALPNGVQLDPATGELSGTLDAVFGPRTYTVTATDGTFSASADLEFRVVALTPADQSISAESGVAFHSAPIRPANFAGPVVFSISPSLPEWVRFDAQSGVLSGTPSGRFPATTYTITASDGDVSASATVTLFVAPMLSPGSQGIIATVGQAVLVPFTARSFDHRVQFRVVPELPIGLTLDIVSGVLSGTPVAEQPAASYEIRATDGSSTASAHLELTVVPPTIVQRDVVTFVTAPPTPGAVDSPAKVTPSPQSTAATPTPAASGIGDAAERDRALWTGAGLGAALTAVFTGAAGGLFWLLPRWRARLVP